MSKDLFIFLQSNLYRFRDPDFIFSVKADFFISWKHFVPLALTPLFLNLPPPLLLLLESFASVFVTLSGMLGFLKFKKFFFSFGQFLLSQYPHGFASCSKFVDLSMCSKMYFYHPHIFPDLQTYTYNCPVNRNLIGFN